MIAELADGTKLKYPDDMPDETMDAMVMHHMELKRNTAMMEKLCMHIAELAAAYREPRKITVERDFKDEKVIGATSIAVKTN